MSSKDGRALVWELSTGQCLAALSDGKSGSGDINGVCYSRDGLRLATGHQDGSIKIWDVEAALGGGMHQSNGLEPLFELLGHGADVFGVAFSPEGNQVVSCSGDGTARVWTSAFAARSAPAAAERVVGLQVSETRRVREFLDH